MISQIQHAIVEKSLALCDLSADFRFGQLMTTRGFLSKDSENQSLWEIEDEQLSSFIWLNSASD